MERDVSLLLELADRHTVFTETGFTVDIGSETELWSRTLLRLGESAWSRMGAHLCARYQTGQGRPFLFSDECVAYELRYHALACLWAMGIPGWRPPVTARLFPKPVLVWRCREIDIYTDDTKSLAQRIIFRYRRGIREEYRNTPEDPFRRTRLFRRFRKTG